MKNENIHIIMAQSSSEKPTDNSTGTRDAVETAIDISKDDKSSTWESNALKKITRWKSRQAETYAPQQ
ncbi:MAG: hypothetical protein ABSA59_16515 [Terriglobia bacterium]|jgi:hypothetical protein